QVEVGRHPGQQVELRLSVLPGGALLGRGSIGVDELFGGDGGAARGAGEADELARAAVDDPAEVAGDADGPVDGRTREADLLLDLVEQLEVLAARPVPLVDERQQWQPAIATHLEQ